MGAINSSSGRGISYANQVPLLFMWTDALWATRMQSLHVQTAMICCWGFVFFFSDKERLTKPLRAITAWTLQSSLTSLTCWLTYFQGGVQVSCSGSRRVRLPAAARCLPSGEGLLQLHRGVVLSQHISDGDRQPRHPWLVLPGALSQDAGKQMQEDTDVSAGSLTCHTEYVQPLVHRPARRWWCHCAQMASRTCLSRRSGTSRPSLTSVRSCLGSGRELTGLALSTGGRTSHLTATSSLGKHGLRKSSFCFMVCVFRSLQFEY